MYLSLTLLGPFQACLNGKGIEDFDTQKTRAFLAYLADTPGKVHSRLALAELFWPERSETQALANLRNNLALLRRILRDEQAEPPFLCIERTAISFNPLSQADIDSVEYMTQVKISETHSPFSAQNLTHLEKAVSLYGGDFLEGFPPLPSSELEEWILSRRETYCTLQVEGLYHLAKACLAQSEFKRAMVFARRQLEIEPWREEAYQQLITALAMDGRRSEALRDFSIFSDLLDKELKVEPSPVTMQLVEAIRSGALSQQPAFQAFWPAGKPGQPAAELVSANPPPHNLPRSLTRLIGRELEILQVKQFLRQQRLVILTGPGGVGKTRLAMATATEVVEQFRDGVWFVELAPLGQEGNIPSLILRALGIDPPPMATGSQLLRHILNNRQMLLILDNCESLIAARDFIQRSMLWEQGLGRRNKEANCLLVVGNT